MKFLGILLLVVLFSASTYAQGVQTSVIANTPHNFLGESWNDANTGGTGSQMCQPCHTPHNAVHKGEALWNHQGSLESVYTNWETRTVNTTNGANTYTERVVGETSKLCLDCHDGQIALSAFGGGSGNGATMGGTPGVYGSDNLGTDLTDDHPINVPYAIMSSGVLKPNVEVTKGSVYIKPITGWDATTNALTYGGAGTGKLRLTNTGTDYRIDCTTCHTPHGTAKVSTDKTQPIKYLLRMENTASAICQTCHAK